MQFSSLAWMRRRGNVSLSIVAALLYSRTGPKRRKDRNPPPWHNNTTHPSCERPLATVMGNVKADCRCWALGRALLYLPARGSEACGCHRSHARNHICLCTAGRWQYLRFGRGYTRTTRVIPDEDICRVFHIGTRILSPSGERPRAPPSTALPAPFFVPRLSARRFPSDGTVCFILFHELESLVVTHGPERQPAREVYRARCSLHAGGSTGAPRENRECR